MSLLEWKSTFCPWFLWRARCTVIVDERCLLMRGRRPRAFKSYYPRPPHHVSPCETASLNIPHSACRMRNSVLRLPEGLDGVVPEDLLHQVGGHLWPAQRQVDGPGEAALGVRVVRAEHEEVIAEVIRDQLDHLAAFVKDNRGKEAAAGGVLQRGTCRGCRPMVRYAYRCRRLCSRFSWRTSFVGCSL